MIIYQGAEAFKLWTGEEMPIDYIKDVLDLNKIGEVLMKILVLNGPNLDMVVIREQGIMKNRSYGDIVAISRKKEQNVNTKLRFFKVTMKDK